MAIDGTQPGGVYPQRFGIPDGLYARAGRGQAGLDVLLERRQLDAHVDRRDRTGPSLCRGDRLDAGRRRRHRAQHHHPGRQDDVPGRPDLVEQVGAALLGALQPLFVPPRPRSSRGHPTAAPRARRVLASSAAWCSSVPPTSRWNANRLGVTRDCRAHRAAGGRSPRSSPARPIRPRQHVVADRDFLDPHPAGRIVDDALIDALVAPAREHQVLLGAPALRVGLTEQPTRRVSGRSEVFRPSRFRRALHPTPAPSSPCRGRHRTASRRRTGVRRGSTDADRAPQDRRCRRQSPCPATTVAAGPGSPGRS